MVCAFGLILLSRAITDITYISEIYWGLALLLVLCLRGVLHFNFMKADPTENPEKWLYALAALAGLTATIWGCSIIFSYNRGNSEDVMTLLIAIMAGMLGVATLSYGLHRLVLWCYLLPFAISLNIYFSLQEGEKYLAFSLAATSYILIMGYMGQVVQNIINNNLILSSRNQTLKGELVEISSENEQSYSSLRSFLDYLGAGIAMFDEEHRLVVWNHAYEEIFDYRADYLKSGIKLQEVIKTYYAASAIGEKAAEKQAVQRTEVILEASKTPDSRLDFKTLNGRIYELKVVSLENKNILLNFMDVTHREQARTDDIVSLAQKDALTGLPNRMMFRSHLKKILRSRDASEYGIISVIHLDIDLFKDINDNYGHPFGDRLLQHIATGLRDYLQEQNLLARYSGDEFAIIGVRHHTNEEALKMLENVVEYIRQPIGIMGHLVKVDVSAGLTVYPEQDGDADKLISNADIALHKAKQAGRGQIIVYEESMHSEIMERASLMSDLRDSMETSQFVLHYQPQIDITSRQICGVEALMRWNHPERGWISPGEFIPLAELSKQIIPLTEQLLPEACMQAKLWQAQGLPPLRVSVNISPLHFQEKGFVDFVRECLEEAGLAPEMLELEITEGIVMSQTEQVMNTLQELADTGTHLSIDDFGTGYSSLSYLRTLPVEKLKIDQCFIAGMEEDPGAQSVVEAIVRLGHSFNLKVIAEGVETQGQLEMLGDIKCDQAQGFYISRPVPADNITDWVKEHYST